jgi:hypothetical protein
MSDAALNLETNRYLDGMFDHAEELLTRDEERAKDALDDEAFFVDVLHEWVDYDTLNTLVRAIHNSVAMGISPELFCKSLHAEIVQAATLKIRREA